MIRHNATGRASRERKGRPEDDLHQEFIVEAPEFDTEHPAVVEVSLGLTINLGNFESARLDVGVRMPCDPSQVKETYVRAKDWCEAQVQQEVREIRGNRRG